MEISKLEQAVRIAIQGNKMQPAFAGVEFEKAAKTLAARADKKSGAAMLKAAAQEWF